MPTTARSEINIPDHEVLRKIGGGAYGEVWMARGVTGALRAVKVVWREDFEDERGFEREFEGILKFEPISRDHPGFVNILHVGRGRDEDNPFYYYVMELGDDVRTGRDFNPVEYTARTLLTDLKANTGQPLDLDFCLDVASKLSDALVHLHNLDLAHRDVKPANVIFVDGKAKLADIGLVAARGQQTFVGTEGFVPPEGPGSDQADVYSLGKVMYEMVTGKDRLQFPELPDSLPEGINRKQWNSLNQLVCSVCDPKLSKRTSNTSKQLSDAISKISQGKQISERRAISTRRWIAGIMFVGLSGYGLYHFRPWEPNDIIEIPVPDIEPITYVNELCSVQFITNPLDARVFADGVEIEGGTPTEFRQYPPGTKVVYKFEKDGYLTLEKEYIIPDSKYETYIENLAIFRPPEEDLEWRDSLGLRYFPKIGLHESGYIKELDYQQFLKTEPDVDPHEIEFYSEYGKTIKVVLVTQATADAYAEWTESEAKKNGLLRDEQYIIAKLSHDLLLGPVDIIEKREQLKIAPMQCVAKSIPFAKIEITSEPEGARVFVDGDLLGVTPMTTEGIRPKDVTIVLRKAGYKATSEIVSLSDNELYEFSAKLVQNNGVVMLADWKFNENEDPHSWVNGSGVKMVQFDEGKMAAVWETQVGDYMDFVEATDHRLPKDPKFPQEDNHPMVGVSVDDAEAYCAWLTEKDRADDRIGPEHVYRLPTDREWSLLNDLKDEIGESPSERLAEAQLDDTMSLMYPWGQVFPPRVKMANLADKEAGKAARIANNKIIKGYDDGYVNTAPVGSLSPNKFGIFDLSGNVYEWVSDSYNKDGKLNVARGGSWASYSARHLKIWSRFPTGAGIRDNQYGFRYVLVDTRVSEE